MITQQQQHYNKKHLPDLIGGGYGAFWRFQGRYRVLKGSRASKKSKTCGLYYITKLMQHKDANLLVVRKTARTLQDSCYKELKWAISRLGVDRWWRCTLSPLEMTYLPTGQKIYFRGLDDPMKVTSITVERGVLCWLWLEEAYEISKEKDFDILDESIRGATPDGLWKQVTLSFNPWNEKHWIKARFYDAEPDPDILALTTNYLINEWLDDADKAVFERMKKNNPKRYRVAGLGEWGVAEGLIFENWVEQDFDIEAIKQRPGIKVCFGLDFGYTIDPSALCCFFIDDTAREIYVFDELYKKQLTNPQLYAEIEAMGYRKERIIADSAEPKSIAELRDLGLYKIQTARKGPDSIRHGIQLLQNYKIIIHPKCVNFITEISNYTWETDRFGQYTGRPIDDMNHLMDAFRYGAADALKKDTFSFD